MTLTRTVQDMTDNITKLSVLSLNINSFSEDKKRSKLFEKLANKNVISFFYKKLILPKKQQINGKKNG